MNDNAAQAFVQSLEAPAQPDLGDKREETAPDSQTGKKPDETENGEEETTEEKPDGGEEKKPQPFHKHPEWIKREKTWEKRLEDSNRETTAKFEAKIKELESKISTRQEVHDELTDADIPEWFNGDLKQYKAYYNHQTGLMEKKAEAIANRILEARDKKAAESSEREQHEVREATEWLESEISRIESDEKLNPTGEPIDRAELFRIAQENDLIDSKRRWNYAAAYRIYASERKGDGGELDENKKEQIAKRNIAALTTKKDSKASGTQKAVATSDSLKKDSPW